MIRPVLAALAVAFLAAAPGFPAAAADLAVRPVERPVPSSVWLGHFSGGRNLAPGADPIPLDWVDVSQRFVSLGDCAAWLKAMGRAYPTYEGWKTCLVIR
jgi:hypothetical protein